MKKKRLASESTCFYENNITNIFQKVLVQKVRQTDMKILEGHGNNYSECKSQSILLHDSFRFIREVKQTLLGFRK